MTQGEPTGGAANPSPTPAPPPPLPPAYAYPPGYLPYASPNLIPPYASPRPRAKVIVGLSWASIVLQVLLLWPLTAALLEWRRAAAGEEVSDGLTTPAIAGMAIGGVMLIVMVVAFVYWLMWVYRTYQNLRALGAEGLTYSPGWAVGYYFIPILNLFRPFQVMRETWQASHPAHGGGTAWQSIAAPGLVSLWWTFHLTSNIVSQISFRLGMRSEDPGVLQVLAWVDVAMVVWDVVLLLIEIRLVNELTDLQDRRADTLFAGTSGPPPGQWPTQAPAPGGWAGSNAPGAQVPG